MKDILGAGQWWFGSSGCKVPLLIKVTQRHNNVNFSSFEQIDIYLNASFIQDK